MAGVLVVSVLIGLITDSVNGYMEGLTEGSSKVVESEHTLILGWNEATPRVLCQIAFLRRTWQLLNERWDRRLFPWLRVPPSTPVAAAPVVVLWDWLPKEEMERGGRGGGKAEVVLVAVDENGELLDHMRCRWLLTNIRARGGPRPAADGAGGAPEPARSMATELEVTQARSEGPLSFNTRGYNNGVPGPTLYVKRGDWLKIDLKNGLNFPTSALPVAHDHAEQVKIAVRDATALFGRASPPPAAGLNFEQYDAIPVTRSGAGASEADVPPLGVSYAGARECGALVLPPFAMRNLLDAGRMGIACPGKSECPRLSPR